MTEASPDDLYDQLKAGLRIDRDALDDALMEQAVCYERVGDEYAGALLRRDTQSALVKQVRAEVDLEIRSIPLPPDPKAKPPTETQVLSMVTKHQRVVEAEETARLYEFELERWSNLKRSFEQRSYAIGHLAGLFAAGYFAATASVAPAAAAHSRSYEAQRGQQAIARRAGA